MSEFDQLYTLFAQSALGRQALRTIKNSHPDDDETSQLRTAKNFAEMAYNLELYNYFGADENVGEACQNLDNRFINLANLPAEQIEALVGYSRYFSDTVSSEAQKPFDSSVRRAIFAQSAQAIITYSPQNLKDKKLWRLMAAASEKIISPENGFSRAEKYPLAMSMFTKQYQGDSESYFVRLGMIAKAVDKLDDKKNLPYVCSEIDNIYQNEGKITPTTAQGFVRHVIPKINEIPNFKQISAEHDCSYGEYGLIGYTNKILTSQWTPYNIHRAIATLKEVPTPDMLKRETIRTTAIQLEEAEFNGLRDVIHSESVGVNELITDMLAYYDGVKNKKPIGDLKRHLREDLKNFSMTEFSEEYFDVNRYEKVIDPEQGLTAVEALQLIADNSHKGNDTPPLVHNPTIDKLSQNFSLQGYTDLDKFSGFLEAVNKQMVQNIQEKKVGISPEMVDLMYWCDKKCANILKNRDFEQQYGDHRTPWFKQMAMFAQITNSPQENFDVQKFNEDFKEVEDKSFFFDGNQPIINQQRKNIFSIFDKLSQEENLLSTKVDKKLQQDGQTKEIRDYELKKIHNIYEQRKKRTISGNLTGEIFQMSDFKKASTPIGKRYFDEMHHKLTYQRPVENTLLKLFSQKEIG